MGFFDWLRPRPQIAITCWLDEGSRARGFVRAVQDDLLRGMHVIVAAHFADALVQAGQALAAHAIRVVTIDRWTGAETRRLAGPASGAPFAVLASRLPDGAEGRIDAGDPAGAHISLRLCDLHVLAAENDRVVRFARSLPGRVDVRAAVSFDDPVMATFASPWVKSMMATMGLREDQSIDSPMVTKGLVRALRKLERKVTGNAPCDSLQEWMQRNLAR